MADKIAYKRKKDSMSQGGPSKRPTMPPPRAIQPRPPAPQSVSRVSEPQAPQASSRASQLLGSQLLTARFIGLTIEGVSKSALSRAISAGYSTPKGVVDEDGGLYRVGVHRDKRNV